MKHIEKMKSVQWVHAVTNHNSNQLFQIQPVKWFSFVVVQDFAFLMDRMMGFILRVK